MRKPAATSHRGVTRQAVAEAAADLVASDGLEALSIRKVADRLGVWPTTVMHHAGGRRDGLVELLIEHLAAGICTELHGSWRARLAELGDGIRRVADRLGVWPTTVIHHAGGRRDGLIPLLI